MSYIEELNTKEWREKRNNILQRDGYRCQHCDKFGACGDDIFIPLHSSYDIYKYIENENILNLIDEAFLALGSAEYTVSSAEFWSKISLKPSKQDCSFKICSYEKIIKANKFSFIPIISNDWNSKNPSWCNVFTVKIDPCSNYNFDWIQINTEGQLPPFFNGRKIPINSYTSICSYKINNQNNTNECIGFLRITNNAISIFFNNFTDEILGTKDTSVYFYTNLNAAKYHIPTLNIHHKVYIKNHKAWEYNDNKLITLCEECHQKEHTLHEIPLINEKNEHIKNTKTCMRCKGLGYLKQYKYIDNGICYGCLGVGCIEVDHIEDDII